MKTNAKTCQLIAFIVFDPKICKKILPFVPILGKISNSLAKLVKYLTRKIQQVSLYLILDQILDA